jgi:hypothetical protein
LAKQPKIYSKTVKVGDRKINATVTAEMIQDLKALTGMDMVAEMESLLIKDFREQMRKEVRSKRKEKLNKLKNIWDNE